MVGVNNPHILFRPDNFYSGGGKRYEVSRYDLKAAIDK